MKWFNIISLLTSILIVALICSCNNTNKKRVLVEGVYAEGDISKDTVFNGLISFYDTTHNRLVKVANYKNGILDGLQTDYYKNGKPESEINYENGKINGEVIIYDSAGIVIEKDNYYYDLLTGPWHEFKNGKISNYHFYSLESELLFTIDYDKSQKIEEINGKNYFFWNINKFRTTASQQPFSELFIYLPNPPKLNLRYSLCIIDNAYTVLKVVKEFDKTKYWETVKLDYAELKPSEMYALRLNIENKIDDKDDPDDIAVMFKKL